MIIKEVISINKILLNNEKRIKAYSTKDQLLYLVEINSGRKTRGLYLIQKGKQLRFVTIYHYDGLHHQLSEEQYRLIEEQITNGLQSLPENITITFEQIAFRKPLINPEKVSSNLTLNLFELDKIRSKNSLSQQGKRLHRVNSMFITLELDALEPNKTMVDWFLHQLQKHWQRYQNTESELHEQRMVNIFSSIKKRIQDLESIFAHQMGLVGLTPYTPSYSNGTILTVGSEEGWLA